MSNIMCICVLWIIQEKRVICNLWFMSTTKSCMLQEFILHNIYINVMWFTFGLWLVLTFYTIRKNWVKPSITHCAFFRSACRVRMKYCLSERNWRRWQAMAQIRHKLSIYWTILAASESTSRYLHRQGKS